MHFSCSQQEDVAASDLVAEDIRESALKRHLFEELGKDSLAGTRCNIDLAPEALKSFFINFQHVGAWSNICPDGGSRSNSYLLTISAQDDARSGKELTILRQGTNLEPRRALGGGPFPTLAVRARSLGLIGLRASLDSNRDIEDRRNHLGWSSTAVAQELSDPESGCRQEQQDEDYLTGSHVLIWKPDALS